jgi:hypothetical protein
MTEAVLALTSSYLWLERSLHVKPREIDWIGSVQTWNCRKGGPLEVIAGGGEGQRPGSFAKKMVSRLGSGRTMLVSPTSGKARFCLMIWTIAG